MITPKDIQHYFEWHGGPLRSFVAWLEAKPARWRYFDSVEAALESMRNQRARKAANLHRYIQSLD